MLGDVFLIRAYEGVNELPDLMKPDLWKGDPITKKCTNLPEKAEDNAMVHLKYRNGFLTIYPIPQLLKGNINLKIPKQTNLFLSIKKSLSRTL